MVRAALSLSLLLSICCLATTHVAADDGTPTPIAVSPAPTLESSTATPGPTVAPAPEAFPTVQQELSTPIISSAPLATEAPTEEPTALPTPTPRPETPITPTRTPVPYVAPTPAPVEVPLPSPAQLEEDARLRWGGRVPTEVRRWAFLIVPAARKYHVNPNLVAAVITLESGGDPLAWNSGSDARGLMQVLHGPWDPHANVYRGVHMLARFLAEFSDVTLALAAYNAGPNAVLAYRGVPPYRETRDYVIVVGYLFDLFDHHRLTERRKLQFGRSLRDLRHFANVRKRVPELARIAQVQIDELAACRHFSSNCGQDKTPQLFQSADPFWPLADAPDPLQRVGPIDPASP